MVFDQLKDELSNGLHALSLTGKVRHYFSNLYKGIIRNTEEVFKSQSGWVVVPTNDSSNARSMGSRCDGGSLA